MVAAVDRGDLAAARAVHNRLIPAVRAIMSPSSQGAIRAKAALQVQGVLSQRTMRLPLLPASDAELGEIRQGLAASGLPTGTTHADLATAETTDLTTAGQTAADPTTIDHDAIASRGTPA